MPFHNAAKTPRGSEQPEAATKTVGALVLEIVAQTRPPFKLKQVSLLYLSRQVHNQTSSVWRKAE
jgi:hypothetical protein